VELRQTPANLVLRELRLVHIHDTQFEDGWLVQHRRGQFGESPVTDVNWIEGTRKNNLRYRNSSRAGNRHLPIRCDVERLAGLQELVERLHESRMDSVHEIAFSLLDDLKCVMSIFGRAQIVE